MPFFRSVVGDGGGFSFKTGFGPVLRCFGLFTTTALSSLDWLESNDDSTEAFILALPGRTGVPVDFLAVYFIKPML